MSITSTSGAVGPRNTGRLDPAVKSMSSAAPGSASIDTVWSIPPVGAPAISVSARMHAATSASRTSGVTSVPTRAVTAMATAHSIAAELDRPAPSGTVLSTSRSAPGTSTPLSRSAQGTPAAYAAQPGTAPGATSSRLPSHASACWRLAIRSRPSDRAAAAT